ncbi:MAG: hypothetical protein JNM39_08095 [Bdellovibrionaceae bacterium]|nr:hypothetical protein [Pseudobdellovibrionaceae bacterium]
MTKVQKILSKHLIKIISETNGISLSDTIELLIRSEMIEESREAFEVVLDFKEKLELFRINKQSIHRLLEHTFTKSLFHFFKSFPMKFKEEHIHLTGALTAEFLYPRLLKLMEGQKEEDYLKRISTNYGFPISRFKSAADVDQLIRLKEGEGFLKYLKLLYLPSLIFISREAHTEAAYHLAEELYTKYNVGSIRIKFSLSRLTSSASQQIPGAENVTSEDVVLGLYEGFRSFQKAHPDFKFVLSPSFRKEASHFDSSKYKLRKDHFMAQVNELIALVDRHPDLRDVVTDVDTVGDERELYRKEHFYEMQMGFRKLQYRGFRIRSHHGETFYTLKKGIQAVDNAMNIWHIDTLEHGVSLGINPNYFFHLIYQEVVRRNKAKEIVGIKDDFYRELVEIDWGGSKDVLMKLLAGHTLDADELVRFTKAKFHTAREVEHYQHDVLNRLIQKDVSIVSLPSSNNKLTGQFEDYKDHPFSWWEKKGVHLGIGTDNYITLNTNYIQELIILLYTDSEDLKITKLLMVATGETRRPFVSHLLWQMRKQHVSNE